MMTSALKKSLGLACVLAVLSGCASNSSQEDANANEDVTSGAETTDVNATDTQAEQVQLESVVYFDFDQSTLTSASRALLMAHAEQLKAAPRAVRLEGHADERGSREYNMALGERRANSVRDFLALQGVDTSLLETISYGEERPVAFASDEASYSANRRVEIK